MALQSEILEVSPYKLWLPLGHALSTAMSVSLADVLGEPLIMLTVDEIEEATIKLLGALGTRPNVAFRTRSVEAVRSLVATGAGVVAAADLVYRPWSLDGDRIESRDVSASLPVVQVGVVWRAGRSCRAPRAISSAWRRPSAWPASDKVSEIPIPTSAQ